MPRYTITDDDNATARPPGPRTASRSRDCQESTTDVLTADGAGTPGGSLDQALATR